MVAAERYLPAHSRGGVAGVKERAGDWHGSIFGHQSEKAAKKTGIRRRSGRRVVWASAHQAASAASKCERKTPAALKAK